MKGLFITGTDTGVGKTVITAALTACLRARGLDAVPMKPVQTGSSPLSGGGFTADDLQFSLKLSGLNPPPAERTWMCPYQMPLAASPHLSARVAGTAISLDIIQLRFGQLLKAHRFVVVEGAGGIHTPLTDKADMRDMAAALALPVVIVSRPSLGTLNHTLLTLHAVREAGMDVIAVVVNESSVTPWGLVEEDNMDTLLHRSGVQHLLRFRHQARWPVTPADHRAFIRSASTALAPLIDQIVNAPGPTDESKQSGPAV